MVKKASFVSFSKTIFDMPVLVKASNLVIVLSKKDPLSSDIGTFSCCRTANPKCGVQVKEVGLQ